MFFLQNRREIAALRRHDKAHAAFEISLRVLDRQSVIAQRRLNRQGEGVAPIALVLNRQLADQRQLGRAEVSVPSLSIVEFQNPRHEHMIELTRHGTDDDAGILALANDLDRRQDSKPMLIFQLGHDRRQPCLVAGIDAHGRQEFALGVGGNADRFAP